MMPYGFNRNLGFMITASAFRHRDRERYRILTLWLSWTHYQCNRENARCTLENIRSIIPKEFLSMFKMYDRIVLQKIRGLSINYVLNYVVYILSVLKI